MGIVWGWGWLVVLDSGADYSTREGKMRGAASARRGVDEYGIGHVFIGTLEDTGFGEIGLDSITGNWTGGQGGLSKELRERASGIDLSVIGETHCNAGNGLVAGQPPENKPLTAFCL